MKYEKAPKYTVKRRPKLHKRWALHVSTVALAVTGGFMPTNITLQGQSISFDVTAKVAAPVPVSAAVITSPTDQDRFTQANIAISGSCPNDSYVKVFQNEQLAGVSPCVGQVFSVSVTLIPGSNTLRSQVYNVTDDEGPASPSITVFYDVPQSPTEDTPSTPASPNQNSNTPRQPLSPQAESQQPGAGITITLERYRYQRLKPNQPWSWNIAIKGSNKPYTISIDWRDGTVQRFERDNEELFEISHIYTENGSYLPFITATDSAGNVASLQLYADVHSDPVAIPHAQSTTNPWMMWSLYAGICLVVAQFWIWEVRAWHRRHKIHRTNKHA